MTGQSLYYMGQSDLKYKILAVAEEEGVAQASYALKLLQSDGRLRIAAAGKNHGTGRNQTESYEVEGPVMMFLTTTSESPDEELQNRCLTLHVNESPDQTAAIHARQRTAYTLDGQGTANEVERITKLHHNAQRLLEPPVAGGVVFVPARDVAELVGKLVGVLRPKRAVRIEPHHNLAPVVPVVPHDRAVAAPLNNERLDTVIRKVLPQFPAGRRADGLDVGLAGVESIGLHAKRQIGKAVVRAGRGRRSKRRGQTQKHRGRQSPQESKITFHCEFSVLMSKEFRGRGRDARNADVESPIVR